MSKAVRNFSINLGGKLLSLDVPIVMGILNITPDSFYEGSRRQSEDAVLSLAQKMVSEGVTILDLGAYSTRPGADDVSPIEEADRLLPALELVRDAFPDVALSVDSFRESVIRQALQAGAHMVNDVTGGHGDEQMLETVAQFQVPYVCMHMRGTPKTMMKENQYDDLLLDLNYYFTERLHACKQAGINDVILDPGVGFAKGPTQNFELLSRLHLLIHDAPMLVGLSRKSFIYRTLGVQADQALNGTTAMHMEALRGGAKILRVHDVAPALECIQLYQALQNN